MVASKIRECVKLGPPCCHAGDGSSRVVVGVVVGSSQGAGYKAVGSRCRGGCWRSACNHFDPPAAVCIR